MVQQNDVHQHHQLPTPMPKLPSEIEGDNRVVPKKAQNDKCRE